jgi:hypothetical protein
MVNQLAENYQNLLIRAKKLYEAANYTCEHICATKEGYEDVGGLRALKTATKEELWKL